MDFPDLNPLPMKNSLPPFMCCMGLQETGRNRTKQEFIKETIQGLFHLSLLHRLLPETSMFSPVNLRTQFQNQSTINQSMICYNNKLPLRTLNLYIATASTFRPLNQVRKTAKTLDREKRR